MLARLVNRRVARFCVLGSLSIACGADSGTLFEQKDPGKLVLNELVSNNEGVALDEFGEADDYIELYNPGDSEVRLAQFRLTDGKTVALLPDLLIAPRTTLLLWADGTPEQGNLHLDFKLSSQGEPVRLTLKDATVVDQAELPALDEHQAYLRVPDGTGNFQICAWATPGNLNGASCGPPEAPPVPPDTTYPEYVWPKSVAPALAITEALLRPATFIELANTTQSPLDLSDFRLTLAALLPGQALPGPNEGVELRLQPKTLTAGERYAVQLASTDTDAVAAREEFEGVISVFDSNGVALDRLVFMRLPEAGSVARDPESGAGYTLCRNPSPGALNPPCDQVTERAVGDRVHQLLTPADFSRLAAAGAELGTESVGFVLDLQAGGVITFLNTAEYDLHYSFVREKIEGLPRLNRCDPAQRQEYNAAWYAFSEKQYFMTEGRRFLLGTLVRHAGNQLATVEFSPGDVITAEQIKLAFFALMPHVERARDWSVRPQTDAQVERVAALSGQLPLASRNAPFSGLTFQPLAPGVSYGTLRFVPATQLAAAQLGPRDIVVTDQVPNDIPLIGGLITEAFQTPLAHVNVLSRGRGTPNLALRAARSDPRVNPLLDKLVRFEVLGASFSLSAAAPEEALAFWESRRPNSDPVRARLDTSVRGMVALEQRGYADLPAVGGKAAQFAELYHVVWCPAGAQIPERAFAVPVAYSLEHFAASGAQERLAALRRDPAFLADSAVRGRGLAEVRQLIVKHPVAPELLAELRAAISERWAGRPLRFRSSSNAEDLPGFNGAGLYTSLRVDGDADAGSVDESIKSVWASLWNLRAYDEREYYLIDHDSVAMGVLVHPAFPSERANGVAVSRDLLDPRRSDRYYINAQVGEALVTNPAPGVRSDEFSVSWFGTNPIFYDHSSFSRGPVLAQAEVERLTCNLEAIHRHYREILDPLRENQWFAMDIEFKLVHETRELAIKQARPFAFGAEPPSNWCEF